MTRMTVSQVRFPSDKKRAGQRFNPELHLRKLRRFWQGKPAQPPVDELLKQNRSDGMP